MFSVFINTDRNKRGQTCYIVSRAQIQTCCFFEWKYKYASFYRGEGEEVNRSQFVIDIVLQKWYLVPWVFLEMFVIRL